MTGAPVPRHQPSGALRPSRSILRRVHARRSEKGRIAAIEPRSGEYVVADSLIAAARLARRRFPRGAFYFVRIGFPSAHAQRGGFRSVALVAR